jgi:hypothetical protein
MDLNICFMALVNVIFFFRFFDRVNKSTSFEIQPTNQNALFSMAMMFLVASRYSHRRIKSLVVLNIKIIKNEKFYNLINNLILLLIYKFKLSLNK